MVYVAHPATGVRRIPDEWLDGFTPSGFRLATVREVAAWHAERGLEAPVAEGHFCPSCLRRVPQDAAERRLHREVCASGPLEVWLFHCPGCGMALAVDLTVTASTDE